MVKLEAIMARTRAVVRNGPLGRIVLFFAIMGPGIITSTVDNDASGITGYSIAGASYGYGILWTVFLACAALAVIQTMAGRMGVVTGKGLSDLIRENFGPRISLLAMLLLLMANAATIASQFAGIAASMEIFAISKYISVPLAGVLIWFFVVRGSYDYVERVLLVGCLFFLCYVLSGFMVRPPWGEVLRQTITPSFQLTPHYTQVVIAIIGTTITPWQQFYLQASVVDKGTEAEHGRYQNLDIFLGAFWCGLIAYFIMLTTAATLFPQGIAIETAQDAAIALRPIAGEHAEVLFALGLLNASVMAAAVLPLSTAYPICEAFGWERGVSKGFGEAPVFVGLFTGLLVVGASFALWPGAPLVEIMFFPNIINGVLMIPTAVLMTRLASNKRLMGQHANGPVFKALAWGTIAVLTPITLAYLVMLVMP